MKKMFFGYVFLLFFSLIPSNIYAASCTTPSISGSSSSYFAYSKVTADSCGYGNLCIWSAHCGLMGLRFRLYSYDGKNYKALGNGVDVWAGGKGISSECSTYCEKNIYVSNGHYTSPDTVSLNLKTASGCATVSSKSVKSRYSLSADQYKATGNVYMDKKGANNSSSLMYAIKSSNVNNWVLKEKTYDSGWIYDNIYSLLINNKDTSFKDLWGVSADDIRSNANNIYIVVEVLFRVYSNSASNFGSGDLYYGTVSDLAPVNAFGRTIKLLSNKDVTVGEMIIKGNKGLIYYGGSVLENVGSDSAYSSSEKITKHAACNYADGMAIYNLGETCEECGASCESDCSSYTSGTVEHTSCAKAWCSVNDPDNSNCVKSCGLGTSSPGCDSAYANKCATYTKDGTTTKSSSSSTCSLAGGESTTETLSTKVCYDEKSSYTIVEDSGTTTEVKTHDNDMSYYKIECIEDLVLSDLPQKTTAYLNSSNIASLYTGYKMEYSKECKLYWLVKNWSSKTTQWSVKYTGSQLANDLSAYQQIIAGNKYTSKMTDDEKKAFKKAAEEAYDDIKNLKTQAQTRLKNVSSTDYKTGTDFTNTATLEIANSGGTSSSSQTVTLVPVYCTSGSSTDEKKCTLENNTNYTMTTYGTAVCTDSSGNENTAKVTISDSGSSSCYSQTVYYGLPSSYVDVTNGDIYTGSDAKSKCLTAVNTANGYCEEYENVWLFDPISKTVSLTTYNSAIGSSALKINLSGYGSCGQFKYSTTCDYDYADASYCTQCIKNYEYGTTEYNTCFNKYCSCDGYCGSNVACRAKYCPTECEGCTYSELSTCSTPDPTCLSECTSYTDADDNEKCQYNCCTSSCGLGNVQCTVSCCVSSCKRRFSTDSIDFKTCISEECSCLNGNCGEDYYYRTIDLDRPFPGGTGLTREPGANWYQKVEYITDNDSHSEYYDSTNGRTSDYEYQITLSSDDIKFIKNNLDTKYSTTYTEYNKSTSVKSSSKMYCSAFLHDYLPSKNINLDIGSTVTTKTGCK